MEQTKSQFSEPALLDPSNKQRAFELDVLRGIAILLMLLDHFTFDFAYAEDWFVNFKEVNHPIMLFLQKYCLIFQDSFVRLAGHYIFATLFLLIAGISCTFSRSNMKRGMKTLVVGCIITAVTLIGERIFSMVGVAIVFGILHLMGVSFMLYAIVERIIPNKWVYLGMGLAMIAGGFLIEWYRAPYAPALTFDNLWRIILGLELYGSDCFGMLPCTGVIFVGAFIGQTFYKEKKSLVPKLKGKWIKPFTWMGRHTLWIYLLHQVLFAIIVVGLGFLLGYHIL